MACLDENTVVALLLGRLDDTAAAAARRHIESCAACREMLALAARTSLGQPGAPAQPSAAMVGRYFILGPIGSGGMGVVFAAYDPKLDRRVALKLLHGGPGAPELAERLMREAQAMARLSHPNVIGVHDVGTVGDQVFLAMEFVDGETLGAWARRAPRPWRDVRDVFVLAGRGLQAAHAAGLVHRDFKPENVLVGKDGRVRVTDFGLARLTAPALAPGPAATGALGLDAALTRTDAVVGSPAYMAPEQMRGESIDQRADVFSFCVALWEALFGQRPFAANDFASLRAAIEAGQVREPPPGARVPGWLRRVVGKGLRPSPAERWASMVPLLAALVAEPGRALKRAALVAALILVALAGSAAVQRAIDARAQLCSGAENQIASAWGAERKHAVRDALVATGRPYAADVDRRVQAALDSYAGAWAAMHRESCEATRRRGEQSERLFDLRMQCLGKRREELSQLTGQLAHADAAVLDKAVTAAASLSPLAACADARALTALVPLPDARTRAAATEVEAQLAQAKALKVVGRAGQALPSATAQVERARKLGYAPLLAEALHLQGDLLEVTGDLKGAERATHEAIWAAEEGHADGVAAAAWVELVFVVGDRQARTAEGRLFAEHARAAIRRAGGDRALHSKLLNNLGNVLYREGRHDEALEKLRESAALFESLSDDIQFANTTNNLGVVLRALGRNDEAIAAGERSLVIKERVLGKEHPAVGVSLTNLGAALAEAGQHARALPMMERGLRIKESALGPRHHSVGIAWTNLGGLLRDMKRCQDALPAYQRGLDIFVAALGPEHPMVAHAALGLGQCGVDLGAAEQALDPLERALRLRSRPGGDPNEVAEAQLALAQALWGSGRDRARARRLGTAARATFAKEGARASKELQEADRWLASLSGR